MQNEELNNTRNYSHIYLKFTILFTFVFISLAFMAFYVVTTVNENRILTNTISDLTISNGEQIRLLNDKASELKKLKENENIFNKTIKEFTEKYREIADKYVSGLVNGSSSRSGSRDVASFTSDFNELKEMLKRLNEISSLDNSIFDLSEAETKLQEYLDCFPTLWPVSGRISSNFGYRIDPITGKKTFHEGMDIVASTGTNIKASASGTVIYSGKKNGYGNVTIIEHGNGMKSLYAHASKLLTKEGQKIEKGEVIAKVGSTGRSTGPHLHFEVLHGNTPVNPNKYLE